MGPRKGPEPPSLMPKRRQFSYLSGTKTLTSGISEVILACILSRRITGSPQPSSGIDAKLSMSGPIGARLVGALALAAAATIACAGDLTGKVVRIQDGDTLTLLVDQRQVRVRLASIDAPESKQPFGTRSRQALADLCHGRTTTVAEQGLDRYGRTLGTVTCAGVDANAAQVATGMAWVYVKYAPKGSPLYELERVARLEKRGLWADDAPVPPWEWRQEKHSANLDERVSTDE